MVPQSLYLRVAEVGEARNARPRIGKVPVKPTEAKLSHSLSPIQTHTRPNLLDVALAMMVVDGTHQFLHLSKTGTQSLSSRGST